jgi:hypothetical protein
MIMNGKNRRLHDLSDGIIHLEEREIIWKREKSSIWIASSLAKIQIRYLLTRVRCTTTIPICPILTLIWRNIK